jgi:molybdate transport system substrate-binding protein
MGLPLICACAFAAAKPVLRVAAAADLAPCIAELNHAFSSDVGGADVTYSIGASGNFYAQIRNGAPYDVFLSADLHYPQELGKAGLADKASLTVYAYGQLAMWISDPRLDVANGLQVLTAPAIHRIAIANPDIAPYGRAAKAALEHTGVWKAVQPKLVIGESMAQAAQFVTSGNAQAGLISFSHINEFGKSVPGRVWLVPADFYPPIEQGAIVTAHGKDNPLAKRYVAFLASDKARAILLKYRFLLPDRHD